MPLPARLITRTGAIVLLSLGGHERCPLKADQPDGWSSRHRTEQRAIDVALDDPRLSWGQHLDGPNAAPREEWPAQCACGAVLDPDADLRSCGIRWRYDTTSGRPEPGDLYWGGTNDDNLYGVCPNGETWWIDGPSFNANGQANPHGWTRTGDPPNVTVSPSIWIQIPGPRGYHGFLQNGQWSDDLEGRTYPAP